MSQDRTEVTLRFYTKVGSDSSVTTGPYGTLTIPVIRNRLEDENSLIKYKFLAKGLEMRRKFGYSVIYHERTPGTDMVSICFGLPSDPITPNGRVEKTLSRAVRY